MEGNASRRRVEDWWDNFVEESYGPYLFLQQIELEPFSIGFLIGGWYTRTWLKGFERKISSIDIQGCSFSSVEAVELFAHVLGMIGKNLERFNLNQLGDDGVLVQLTEDSLAALFRSLGQLLSLEVICLYSGNFHGPLIGHGLQNLLRRDTCAVKDLQFHYANIDDEMYQLLMESLEEYSFGLRNLCLSECDLTDKRLEMLVDSLRRSPTRLTLKQLDVSHNRDLSAVSFHYLATILCDDIFKNLKALKLDGFINIFDGVELDHEGYLKFTNSLECHKMLETLIMSFSNLTDALAAPLFRALQFNSTLLDLDILNSGEDHMISSALVESLPQMRLTSLAIKLDLRNFTGSALCQAFIQNTRLTKLYFNPSDDDPFPCELSQTLRRNKLLKRVSSMVASKACWRERNALKPRNWPHCFEQLTKNEAGPNASYLLVTETLPKLLGYGTWPGIYKDEDTCVVF